MSAIENHEQALAGSAVDPVVMGELCKRQAIAPVGLSVVHEDAKVLLDFLID